MSSLCDETTMVLCCMLPCGGNSHCGCMTSSISIQIYPLCEIGISHKRFANKAPFPFHVQVNKISTSWEIKMGDAGSLCGSFFVHHKVCVIECADETQ